MITVVKIRVREAFSKNAGIQTMKAYARTVLRITYLAIALFCCQSAIAEELWFPPEMIAEAGEAVDLSAFEKGGQQPGRYKVAVFMNKASLGVRDVLFLSADTAEQRVGVHDDSGLVACLTRDDLLEAGVHPNVLGDADVVSGTKPCLAVGSRIPQATTAFDFQKMRLDITIPQRYLQKLPRNWVASERWDDGISAGLVNYTFSGQNSQGRYGSSRSEYLRLNSGFNVGAWRIRDERTMNAWSGPSDHHHQWRHERTWIERGIRSWQSRLLAGDTATDGNIFDAVSIRGARLITDDTMYPDSQRGYAPLIRGTALTNSQITIRQNGYVVYQTNVAPGEFAIDDIDPMYSSGDLQVTVTEADGAIRTFTVPYATLPTLLREGRINYTLSTGWLREDDYRHSRQPAIVQGTLSWGLPFGTTAYGGMQYAKRYQSAALGTGVNMGNWGAFSTNVTHARSTLSDGSQHHGQSFRFLYNQAFNELGTTFQLMGYRYSTQGFYTLEESHRVQMYGWSGEQERDITGRLIPRPVNDWYDLRNNRRERMEISVSQRVGTNSALYLTGSSQTYWHNKGANRSIQAGFSSVLGAVNYNLSYGENHTPVQGHTDRSLSLSLSLPLVNLFSSETHPMFASFTTRQNSRGESSQQAGLSGSALEQNNLHWNLSQGHSYRNGDSSSLRLAYQGAYGNVSSGYSQGQDFRQTSYDLSGSAVLHRDGITLGHPLGSTNVLIAAPGATGIPLEGSSGVKTDWRGYAVQPWANEFRENRIALDVAHLDAKTEIEAPVARVIPTKGAIVRADFTAKIGLRALIALTKNDKPLPFGTIVNTEESSGIVDDGGQVYLSGIPYSGTLTATWGSDDTQKCRASWHIDDATSSTPLVRVDAICQ
ncbi:fimbrial protein FimD [Pectobacterium zantedeschiae]|nr:fimbrial protein FimD [Pectobacterium zantedeschiae]